MPDGVPTGVANAFSALIPATVIITAATIFVGLVEQLFKVTTIEVIYNLIQTPMQGLTDSIVWCGAYVFPCTILMDVWGARLNCSWWHHEWLATGECFGKPSHFR